MSMKKEKSIFPVYSTCPDCGRQGTPTLWMPPPGIDHELREFSCRFCRKMFYSRITNPATLQKISHLQADMQSFLEEEQEDARIEHQASLDKVAATSPGKRRRAPPDSGR